MPEAPPKVKHRIITGLNYGDRRVEPGDIVDDIPGPSVGWLLEQGHIEVADPGAQLS